MKAGIETELYTEKGETLDIIDFLKYLFRKYRILLAASVLGLAVMMLYAFVLADPVFEATAQLYVVNSNDSALDLSDLQIGSYLTSDYQLVFETWEVNQQVIENLSLPYTVKDMQDMVTVTNPGNTRALMITVASSNGAEAALIANEMAYVGRKYISETMKTEVPSILSTALEPILQSKPQKKLLCALGFIGGFAIAVIGLFIAYIRDDKLKTGIDLMKCVDAVPLAIVPINMPQSGRKVRV